MASGNAGDSEGLWPGDEQIRARIMQSRQTVELTASESWRLLACVSLGRIVFTQRGAQA